MLEILKQLFALQQFCSDLHYNFVAGYAYFGIHKLMDEVREPLEGYMDEIKEVIYLGHSEPAPSSKSIVEGSLNLIPDVLDLHNLIGLFDLTLQHIENVKSDLDAGSAKILDDISAHLLKYRGLVQKSVDNR